jgi:hypothetical protein
VCVRPVASPFSLSYLVPLDVYDRQDRVGANIIQYLHLSAACSLLEISRGRQASNQFARPMGLELEPTVPFETKKIMSRHVK